MTIRPAIRPATLADVPRLVAMGRQQIAALYGGAVADDPAALEALATQLVTAPTCACFVADQEGAVVGMIGLVGYAHHLSGVSTVGEVMWWVDPGARGAGLALLRRAERWAAETGAQVMQMMAPATNPLVGRLYERRGYQAVETTYQAAVTPAMSAIRVVDDVLPDFPAYVAGTRSQPFSSVEPSTGAVFHGIAAAVSDALPQWIAARYPALTPTKTFVRRSPAGQAEPNFIHTDRDMGDWTAIAYLTEAPPAGDGTTFYRWARGAQATGAIASTATTGEALLAEWLAWRDGAQWERWHTVPARPNRVVLFPACYFHSRAIPANYGAGDTARLIQVVFGTGGLP
jgi:GNAT superfamily N-acetyltransferase